MSGIVPIKKILIDVNSISATRIKATAVLIIYCQKGNSITLKSITVTPGDDLYTESNFLKEYKTGFFIENIDKANDTVTFANGLSLSAGEKYEEE